MGAGLRRRYRPAELKTARQWELQGRINLEVSQSDQREED